MPVVRMQRGAVFPRLLPVPARACEFTPLLLAGGGKLSLVTGGSSSVGPDCSRNPQSYVAELS